MSNLDIIMFREMLQPFVQFFSALFMSGVATTVATQILKMKIIPIPAEKYPRATAAIVASLATIVAIYMSDLNLVLNSLWEYLAFAMGTFLIGVNTYNAVVKGSKE